MLSRSSGPDGQSVNTEPVGVRDELLRHLDSAYDLARWMCRNDHDAADVVQESFVRALRFVDQCRGESARPWLLRIVRNTCQTWLSRNRQNVERAPSDGLDSAASDGAAPDVVAQRQEDVGAVRRAIESLPEEFREVIVLREIESLSYKEIAAITELPIGTVMSRLSRGRERLKELLTMGGRAEVTS